jgi:hypothetical protein
MSDLVMVGLAAVVGATSAVAGGVIIRQVRSLLDARSERKKATEVMTMTGTQIAQGHGAKVTIHGVGIKVVVADIAATADTAVANTAVSEATTKTYTGAPASISPKVQVSSSSQQV